MKLKGLLLGAAMIAGLGIGQAQAQTQGTAPSGADMFNPFTWMGMAGPATGAAPAGTMNMFDPMSMMGMMMGQPQPGALNLARPEGWIVFIESRHPTRR